MKKNRVIIRIFLVFLSAANIYSEAISAPYYLFSESKSEKIISEKNKKSRIPVASIAKLFTAYYAIQKNSLNSEIQIVATSPSESKVNPKAAKFIIGEIFTLNQILHAMLMTSSNIASLSLASSLNGSEKKFTENANHFFLNAGFLKTHLDDSHGLSEKTESGPEEITKLLNKLYEEKSILEILRKKEYILSSLKQNQRLLNTLEMTEYKDFKIFGKTGSTKKAGKCFAGYLEKQNKIYTIVLLNSKNIYLDIKILSDGI